MMWTVFVVWTAKMSCFAAAVHRQGGWHRATCPFPYRDEKIAEL
jgi:hypothetical protein